MPTDKGGSQTESTPDEGDDPENTGQTETAPDGETDPESNGQVATPPGGDTSPAENDTSVGAIVAVASAGAVGIVGCAVLLILRKRNKVKK